MQKQISIVVAVIALLTMIAVPTYRHYTKSNDFKNVIAAGEAFKLTVEACYQKQGGTLAKCGTPGTNGIPMASQAENVKSITVASGGVVKAIGGGNNSIDGVTLILTPNVTNGILIWSTSGTCVDKGLC